MFTSTFHRTLFIAIVSFCFFGANPSQAQSISIPYYGNWCGQGHGGYYAPVDELDCACMEHDIDYMSTNYMGPLASSDQLLAARANQILRQGYMTRYAPTGRIMIYRGYQIVEFYAAGAYPLTQAQREKLMGIVGFANASQLVTLPYQGATQTVQAGWNMVTNTGQYFNNTVQQPTRIIPNTVNYVGNQAQTLVRYGDGTVRAVSGAVQSGGQILESGVRTLTGALGF